MKKLFSLKYLLIFFGFSLLFSLIYTHYWKESSIAKITLIPSAGIYCLKAKVEGKSYLFKLDTGSTATISMDKARLAEVRKKQLVGSFSWHDVNNNMYTSNTYRLENISFDKFTLHSPEVQEEPSQLMNNGDMIKFHDSQKNSRRKSYPSTIATYGRIGTPVIQAGKYWLLDIPNNCLYLIKDLDKVKSNKELKLDTFIDTNILSNKKHIVILIKTDFGIKKFAIDTCSELSILKDENLEASEAHNIFTKQFIINDYDFGTQELIAFPMQGKGFKDLEGILGLDFLEKHQLLLDFENNKAYISR